MGQFSKAKGPIEGAVSVRRTWHELWGMGEQAGRWAGRTPGPRLPSRSGYGWGCRRCRGSPGQLAWEGHGVPVLLCFSLEKLQPFTFLCDKLGGKVTCLFTHTSGGTLHRFPCPYLPMLGGSAGAPTQPPMMVPGTLKQGLCGINSRVGPC